MSITYKTLHQSLLASTAVTSLYTVAADATIVSSIRVVNVSTVTTATIKMWQTPTSGTSESDSSVIQNTLTLGPGEAMELTGPKTLSANACLKAQASVANVLNVLVEGGEVGGTVEAWGNAGATAYKSVNGSLANATWTPVTWDAEGLDIDGMHSTAGDTERLTCVTPGTYIFTALVLLQGSATGARAARMYHYNSANVLQRQIGYWEGDGTASGSLAMTIASRPVSLVAGDYVVVEAYQGSGGSLTLYGTPEYSYFGGVRVGYQTNPVDLPGTYVAKIVAANSGAPTHTSNGGWQKVGSGGGTLTWVAEMDKRPNGVSAQADVATNKRIDIRKTGLYRVDWGGSLSSISDGKIMDFAVYKNGALMFGCGATTGVSAVAQMHRSELASLTSGDYLELYAYQNDSASEAYYVATGYPPHLSIEYLGTA